MTAIPTSTALIEKLRKVAVCVHIAAEEGPANDISQTCLEAADALAASSAREQEPALRDALLDCLAKIAAVTDYTPEPKRFDGDALLAAVRRLRERTEQAEADAGRLREALDKITDMTMLATSDPHAAAAFYRSKLASACNAALAALAPPAPRPPRQSNRRKKGADDRS